MPNYRYKVRDKSGKEITGVISAEDKTQAARSLNGMGYLPISIDDVKKGKVRRLRLRRKRVRQIDLNVFTRQLVTLQKAGLPLLASLGTIEKQLKNRTFKDIIKEVSLAVETGSSFSSALEKHPQIFNELYISMVRAGEAGGILDEVLERLAELGDSELETRRRTKSALRYPLMATIVLILGVTVLVTLVIPRFATIFGRFKTALPLPTRILLGVSGWLRQYFCILILTGIAFFFAFRRFVSTEKGRFIWDSVKLKVPIFGPLIRMLAMSKFTRITSLLIRSGLPILQVLSLTSRSVENAAVARTIDSLTDSVREGKGLNEPMRASGMFPPMVLQMVAVGEETGNIDELLLKVSDYYDEQTNYIIQNLTGLIEPIFVSFMGVIMLIVALAIFLPMWNLMALFR